MRPCSKTYQYFILAAKEDSFALKNIFVVLKSYLKLLHGKILFNFRAQTHPPVADYVDVVRQWPDLPPQSKLLRQGPGTSRSLSYSEWRMTPRPLVPPPPRSPVPAQISHSLRPTRSDDRRKQWSWWWRRRRLSESDCTGTAEKLPAPRHSLVVYRAPHNRSCLGPWSHSVCL